MRGRSKLVVLCAAALAAALAGCGGDGGGGGSDVIDVHFSPASLTTAVFDDTLGESRCVRATLSPVPPTTTYVKVTDSGATFAPGTINMTTVSSDTFQACIPLASGLPAGAHTGTLTMQICKDSACAQPYTLTRSTVPYTVTMYHVVQGLPPLDATILVNGVAPANVNAAVANPNVRTYGLAVRNGDTIEVDPSQPQVSLYYTSPVSMSLGFVGLSPTSVSVKAQLAPAATSGSCQLVMRAADGRTIEVTIDATP